VIGACISTANSQLLLIASSFTYDVMRGISHKEIPANVVVNISRLAVLCGGTLAMLLTLHPPDFTLSYGGDVWGVIAILLFPPLYGTLLDKRLTRRGIWACLVAGCIAIAVFYPLYYRGLLAVHPAMLGVPLSTAAMMLASMLDRRRGGGQL
jgi:SSS family solute:Na+ symporter